MTDTPKNPLKSTVANFTDADKLQIHARGKRTYQDSTYIPPLVTLSARDGSCCFQFDMTAETARFMAYELLKLATVCENLEAENISGSM